MLGIGLLPDWPTRQRLSTPHDAMAENEDLHCEGPGFKTRAVSSSSATRTIQHDVAPRGTVALLWPTQTNSLRMRSPADTWN